MTLSELNFEAHKELKLTSNAAIVFATARHMLPLRVSEVSQAMSDFPVFMSSVQSTGDYALSALTSFEPQKNLFLKDNEWQSGFRPVMMQTYPFFLIQNKSNSDVPLLGIDPESPALVLDQGEALFANNDRPALWVSQMRARLLEDSRNIVHTFEFFERVEALELIRPIDISVKYVDETKNTITGLLTINEDRLHGLSPENLAALRDKGYLAPIYAMLFSVYQLNALIRRHNSYDNLLGIQTINLEVSRDLSGS